MGWNGGQVEQYCDFCRYPVSNSVDNRKVTCIECGKTGCFHCTKIHFENRRPTCHFVHRDNCSLSAELRRDSFDSFCQLVDNLIEGSLISSANNCRKLVQIIECRNPELFRVRRGNDQVGHFDLSYDQVLKDFCLQLVNPSGSSGGMYRISIYSTQLKRNLTPKEVIEAIYKKVHQKISETKLHFNQ